MKISKFNPKYFTDYKAGKRPVFSELGKVVRTIGEVELQELFDLNEKCLIYSTRYWLNGYSIYGPVSDVVLVERLDCESMQITFGGKVNNQAPEDINPYVIDYDTGGLLSSLRSAARDGYINEDSVEDTNLRETIIFCFPKDLTTETEFETLNTQSTNKVNKMTKVTITETLSKNKAAAITAGKIEAGRIAIKQVSKVVTPKLPMMMRGYADTAIGRVVMANLFNFAVQQFASDNKTAQLVSDAMLEGAMLEMLQSFNVQEMIEGVVDKVDIRKLGLADTE